jgi:signal transduction histidine kinase
MPEIIQAAGQAIGQAPGLATEQGLPTERRRVEAVVETLATLRSESESLAELAHDARNMVTALGLYCDLLEEPGVLATQFTHYGNELRLVAAASRRLVEKLVALDVRGTANHGKSARGGRTTRQPATLQATTFEAPRNESQPAAAAPARTGAVTGPAMAVEPARRWDLMPPVLIANLAQELLLSRDLLCALAGPSVALSVDVEGGALPVRLNAEDLTRVLVNLVKNAAEAMPAGGAIRISLRKRGGPAEARTQSRIECGPEAGLERKPASAESGRILPQVLSLTVEDSGPGIPRKALERIFEAGFTTRATATAIGGGWPAAHRGLGLSITRSIIEAAGGRIYATNREGPGTPGRGARFEMVLPVRNC